MKTNEAVEQFKQIQSKVILQETSSFGEITIEVAKENLLATLSYFKNLSTGYETLMDLTAVDYLNPVEHTKVVYWLHNPTNFERLRIVVNVGREEPIDSAIPLWAGADWYEREIYDLFGVVFNGHSDLKRILMPDDWQGHPLRKNYALIEEPVEFKHGVKPKVPSQIICTTNEPENFN